MKKKQAAMPRFVIIVVIIVLGAAFFLSRISSGRTLSPREYFGVSGQEAAIVVDGNVLEKKGIVSEGTIYIPYDTLWRELDAGYYLKNDGSLCMVLPEETLTWSRQQQPELFLEQEDTLYISAAVLEENGRLAVSQYADPARLVVRTPVQDVKSALVTKDTPLRTKAGGGNKVTGLVKDDTVYWIEQPSGWLKAYTPSGYSGYVQQENVDTANAADAYLEPEERFVFRNIDAELPVSMVWHYVDMPENNAYLSAYLEETRGLNVISPTWFFAADGDGNLTSFADTAYMDTARKEGIAVWPSLTDTFAESAETGEVLADDAARQRITEQLMAAADAFGFEGINVDLEMVKAAGAHDFLQFLRELTAAAHTRGLIVSVDNFVPAYTGYYNRKAQAEIVDYLVVMAYDEHTASSDAAGSVASLPFVRQGIEATLAEVPASRVILGVPFYTRGWTEEMGKPGLKSAALTMETAEAFVQEHGITLYFDEAVGQYTGTGEDSSCRYSIWMEEETSMGRRLDLVSEYGLAGAAAWRIGFESNNIWTTWEQYLGQ